jgi:PAS domain S-box-containing protein
MPPTMVISSQATQPKNPRFDTPRSPTRRALASNDLAVIALDDLGVIQNCNEMCEEMFGYRQDELPGRHVSLLLPQLHDTEVVQGERVNSHVAFLCHSGIPFQAERRDGRQFPIELFINRLGTHNVVVLVRSLEKSS